MRNRNIERAVKLALLSAGSIASIVPAFAQDQEVEEVVVTGSRIAQPNLETTSPVTQVTADDIATQGVTRVEDLVNQLPQAFAAQNASVSNGATGTATVNLRGLGSARTLVLVDGRRMPYGGVTQLRGRPEPDPGRDGRARRSADRRRVRRVRFGRDRRRRQLHHEEGLRGRAVRRQYGLYQHNNDYGGPGAVKLRDVIAGRAATNPAQFQLPDDNVTDGDSVRVQRH